ncbi:MAG: glycine cleavage system protein GcvH [Bacillota bacterium]
MAFPKDRKYTKDHEYVKAEGSQGVLGVTAFAAEHLGDIVFVELPSVGKVLKAKDVFATLESVKAVSDSYTGVAGKVVKVNQKLNEEPSLINKDPHGEGWICVIEIANPAELDALMDADTYDKYQAEAEVH